MEADTSHPMAQMRMLYVVTVPYIFKVIKFLEIISYLISGKR